MKHIFKSSAVALAVGTAMVAPAANADISITGSVRAGLVANDAAEDDFALRSVGSRFIMSASEDIGAGLTGCLLYTSPSPRDRQKSRMPSSA